MDEVAVRKEPVITEDEEKETNDPAILSELSSSVENLSLRHPRYHCTEQELLQSSIAPMKADQIAALDLSTKSAKAKGIRAKFPSDRGSGLCRKPLKILL